MASLCRSAAKSVISRALFSKSAASKSIPSPFSSSTRSVLGASRVVSAIGSVESMMPLHSAIANARLKSIIAVDSSCWSWMSQGLALPL
ncbi:unnamed protein product [Rhodiola kirilowii]